MTDQSAAVPTGTQSETESERASGWTQKRLGDFWKAMTGLYGRSWRTEHGDEMPDVWHHALLSMTPDEAVLGWKACKNSPDTKPCTLPAFLYRVKCAIASKRPTIPEYKPLPAPPRNVQAEMAKGAKEAAEKAAKVDVQRLRRALKGQPVLAAWPRRTILRGQTHPAGRFDLDDVMRMKTEARQEGRSMWDVDLELMAYNGWSPDDEAAYDKLLALQPSLRTPKDKGSTPFLDAWRDSEGGNME